MTQEKLPHDHGEDMKSILEHMPSQTAVDAVSAALKQVGEPSRLRIFWLLCHREECVVNIAALTQMSSPAVSHHLRLLKECGLITSHRAGKEMYYRASDTQLAQELHHIIENIAHISCPEEEII